MTLVLCGCVRGPAIFGSASCRTRMISRLKNHDIKYKKNSLSGMNPNHVKVSRFSVLRSR